MSDRVSVTCFVVYVEMNSHAGVVKHSFAARDTRTRELMQNLPCAGLKLKPGELMVVTVERAEPSPLRPALLFNCMFCGKPHTTLEACNACEKAHEGA